MHAFPGESTDRPASPGAADWLGLAAAPTFIGMALVTVLFGDGMADRLCSMAYGTSPFNGMVTMYLLMGAFHLPPWLRLLVRWRRRTAAC